MEGWVCRCVCGWGVVGCVLTMGVCAVVYYGGVGWVCLLCGRVCGVCVLTILCGKVMVGVLKKGSVVVVWMAVGWKKVRFGLEMVGEVLALQKNENKYFSKTLFLAPTPC